MDIEQDNSFKSVLHKVIMAITLLWVIKITEIIMGWDFSIYSIFPRDLSGLTGLLFGPLLHSSFEHLFYNTSALLVLATALFYEYPKSAKQVTLIIYFGSGLGVWLFARESYHLGASGLTHGMMFFLFIIGILRRDRPAMAISMIVFFLYGNMIWTVLPTEERISFESHLFGALAGTICAFIYRNTDPKQPEKKYSWELEDEEHVDEERT